MPVLAIANTTVAADAFANVTVNVLVCADPLLVNALVESEALLMVAMVVVPVTLVVFVQLNAEIINNIKVGIIIFFIRFFICFYL